MFPFRMQFFVFFKKKANLQTRQLLLLLLPLSICLCSFNNSLKLWVSSCSSFTENIVNAFGKDLASVMAAGSGPVLNSKAGFKITDPQIPF